jgi:hypothetical protein
MHRLPKPAGATACEAAELGGPSRSTLTTSTGSRRRFDELYGPMPKKERARMRRFHPTVLRRDVHLWAHTARAPSPSARNRGRSGLP